MDFVIFKTEPDQPFLHVYSLYVKPQLAVVLHSTDRHQSGTSVFLSTSRKERTSRFSKISTCSFNTSGYIM